MMPISFACPHCGANKQADEQFIGTTGSCAHCQGSITVPGPDGRPAHPRGTSRTILVIAGIGAVVPIGGFAAMIGVMFFAVSSARDAARTVHSKNNLMQIARAMITYDVRVGQLPFANKASNEGGPPVSWRVLLLRDLGHDDLFEAYNFNEPWDSPLNLQVARRIPSAYQHPMTTSDPDNVATNYLVVAGPGTAFSGRPTRLARFRDGLSDTILVAECAEFVADPWTRPIDFEPAKMEYRINNSRYELGNPFGGDVSVAFADGSVRSIPEDTPPDRLEAMTTISGGD